MSVRVHLIGRDEVFELCVGVVDPLVSVYVQVSPLIRRTFHWTGSNQRGTPVYEEVGEWETQPFPFVAAPSGQMAVECGDPDPLPAGVQTIVEYIAGKAAGYTSGLKWNEVNKLKADMMNRPKRWEPVSVDSFEQALVAQGMSDHDVKTATDLLRARKEGRRLVPRPTYREFAFTTPID